MKNSLVYFISTITLIVFSYLFLSKREGFFVTCRGNRWKRDRHKLVDVGLGKIKTQRNGGYNFKSKSACENYRDRNKKKGGKRFNIKTGRMQYCREGEFSTVDDVIMGNLSCRECPAGSYCTLGERIDCEKGNKCINGIKTPCPKGYYQDKKGESSCISCPHGTYKHTTGGTSKNACIDCEKGNKCINGIKTPCPEGYYQDKKGKSSCISCPHGTYKDTKGGTSKNACISCPHGNFTYYTGRENIGYCTLCPKGSVCPNGKKYNCPVGTYQTEQNKTLASDCKACPKGKYCWHQDESPSSCPAGTYKNTRGGRGRPELDCKKCPIGTYGDEVAGKSNAVCKTCPKGHYCDNKGTTEPTPCDAGTYKNTTGGKSNTACNKCPIGTYGVQIGGESDAVCEPCPEGHYCPNQGTKQPTQCEPGTYKNTKGGKTKNSCVSCPAGYSCPNYGTITPTICNQGTFQSNMRKTVCNPCPKGHYCPKEGTIEPTKCLAGTYKNTTGGTSKDECKPCTKGHYCPNEGTQGPIPCERGHYQADEGKTKCNFCGDIGKFSNYIGKVKCSICPEGKYPTSRQNAQAHYCLDCPPGTFCRMATKAEAQKEKEDAKDEGRPIRPGLAEEGSIEPRKCPKGTSSSGGLARCEVCRGSLYTDKLGAHVCYRCNGTLEKDSNLNIGCKNLNTS